MTAQTSSDIPSITIAQASLEYQGEILFADLNLTLPASKWTVLLGPSGVGKTSLLRLIAGLHSDAKTHTPLLGSDGMPLAGRIAYLPQNDCLLPWLSVLDNVLLSMRLDPAKKNAPSRENAYHLLQQVGLAQHLHKRPAELSGGMRQRVALVRTLIQDKAIVLMDEPFSSLDAVTRLQLQELAANLLHRCTVLLVTHDPLEALRLGDNIYIMAGRPARLSEPLHPIGNRPRSLSDTHLLSLQAELLANLTQAKEAL